MIMVILIMTILIMTMKIILVITIMIDKMVIQDCHRGNRNLSMARVDVKKAYDYPLITSG